MDKQLTVTMPEETFQCLQKIASAKSQDLSEFAANALAQVAVKSNGNMNGSPDPEEDLLAWLETAEGVDPETIAFVKMHPELKAKHFGQYVAVYKGQLIDRDTDFGALYDRIDAAYPDEYVYMSKVEDEPIRTVRIRSFRISNE